MVFFSVTTITAEFMTKTWSMPFLRCFTQRQRSDNIAVVALATAGSSSWLPASAGTITKGLSMELCKQNDEANHYFLHHFLFFAAQPSNEFFSNHSLLFSIFSCCYQKCVYAAIINMDSNANRSG